MLKTLFFLFNVYLKVSSDTVVGAAYSNLDLKMNFYIEQSQIVLH